jgi:hypothetical protein
MSAAALTLALFDDVAPAPSPPPRTALPRPRMLPVPVQGVLPIVRLPVVPDFHQATAGLCLAQQDECAETDCRYHLGGIRELDGERYGCALAVASEHQGLPPVTVAALLGIPEGLVQEAEHRAQGYAAAELARVQDEERQDAERAARREAHIRAWRERHRR